MDLADLADMPSHLGGGHSSRSALLAYFLDLDLGIPRISEGNLLREWKSMALAVDTDIPGQNCSGSRRRLPQSRKIEGKPIFGR